MKTRTTIICSIPMRDNIQPAIYRSDDKSVPASERAVRYPVNSFLDASVSEETDLKIILLAKTGENSAAEQNISLFRAELESLLKGRKVTAEYHILDTAFSEEKNIHEQLMGKIIDELDTGSHVVADITYGPKDIPIVMFSALNFAEKFLRCEIDSILYGLAEFQGDGVVNTRLCDMSSLFYLSSVTNTIHAQSPDKAKQMLKTLLSF